MKLHVLLSKSIALSVTLLELNSSLLSKSLSFFVSLNCIKINTGVFLNCVIHSKSSEWLSKVNLCAVVSNLSCTAYSLGKVSEHALRKFHHTLVICVCLIKLHKCELRIVSCINTLVTVYSSDFVNSLKTTNDKSLKIKL